MEKIVTVVSQSPLQKNDWKNPRGEMVTIKSKKIVVTDGVDTFECEATDKKAEDIEDHPLEMNYPYRMQFQMTVREKEKEGGGKFNYTTIRLLNYGKI
jgi:hypothetical protein